MRTVLLTGGLGFIGSHTAVELMENGDAVIIIDNLSNSKEEVLNKIEIITGKKPALYKDDACEEKILDKIFSENRIDSVIHFAGYKAVGESIEKPIEYYKNNLGSTIAVLSQMIKHGVKSFVLSSSATVYGSENPVPYKEEMSTGTCSNPYGWTKLMSEQISEDVSRAFPEMSVLILRYFNPIGAHESGLIGEDPKGIPNNLMPYICKVATGEYKELSIFGGDYLTHDGTGVRDYIHVEDLAKGHVKALEYSKKNKGTHVFNLGTGKGYSVLDLVKTFERTNGVKIPYKFAKRRSGDLASAYSDCNKVEEILNWTAKKDIRDMCRDSWNFVNKNNIS